MHSMLKMALATTVALGLPEWAAAADGKALWTKHCAMCHGADGTGQTPMGTKLKVKNFTDPAVQALMTDEMVLKSIADGRKDEAGKLVMPTFAAKIPEEDRSAVLAYLRTLVKKP